MVLSISKCAPVAQGIERRFPKPCVGGSNPLGSANSKPLENVEILVLSAVFALNAVKNNDYGKVQILSYQAQQRKQDANVFGLFKRLPYSFEAFLARLSKLS